MEITKNNRLIVGILLSVIVVSFYSIVQPLNEANALQLVSVTTGNQNATLNVPIVYHNFNAHAVVAGKFLLIVNSSNTVLLANLTLPITAGKFVSGIDCQNTGQLQKSSSINTGGTEYCVISQTGASSLDNVFLIDVTNGVSTGWGFFYHNDYLFSNCVIWNIPQIAGTIACMYSDTAVANHVFIDYLLIPYHYANGLPTTPDLGKNFTQSSHFDTGYTSGVAQPNFMRMTVILNQITGLTTYEMMWSLHGGTQVALFNLGSQAQICTTATGVEAFNIQFGTDPSGVNKWYATVDNAIKVITDATCTLTNTLTLSSYDSAAAHIRGIAIGTIRKEIYLYDDLGNLISMNQSTFAKIGSFPIAGDSVGVDSSRQILSVNDNLSIGGAGQTDVGIAVTSNTKYYIQYWATAGANPTPSSSGTCNPSTLGVGQFCNSSGQTCINVYDSTGNVLITTYCSTSSSNGKITTPNTISSINTGANLTTMGNTFGCGLGLTSCTNTNIQTNGVGLFFLLLLIVFSYAMLVAIHYKVANKVSGDSGGTVQITQVMNVNPMLLTVMLGADLFIANQVNWISGIPLYTFVAGIIGFISFGIYKHYTGARE